MWDSDDGPRPDIAKIISRLLHSDHLRELNPAEKLIDLDNPTLKAELKALGLKTSGTKKEMIARLLSVVSKDDLERLTENSDLVELTELGRSVLESARDLDSKLCSAAVIETAGHIRRHDIASARQSVFAVSISRGGVSSFVPRSFRAVDDPPSPDELSALFAAWPDSLGDMGEPEQEALRVSTAMYVLWNEDPMDHYPTTAPRPLLPLQVAVNHLWNAASRRGRASNITGSVVLEHFRSQDPMCGKCSKLVGRSFKSADIAPHLPLKGCMTTDGCPLHFDADWDDDSNGIDVELLISSTPDSPSDLSASLREASILLAEGLINETEFDALKSEILRRLSGR